MEIVALKRFLSGLGFSTSGSETDYLTIESLRAIILFSDGNQFCTPFTDKVKFDFANKLIKVKKYHSRQVTSLFNSSASFNENDVLVIKSYNGRFTSSIVEPNLVTPPRRPQKDDILFVVDQYGKKVAGSETTIQDILFRGDYLLIQPTTVFREYLKPGCRVVCAMGDLYPNSSTLGGNDSLSLYFDALSENKADIYINLTEVEGFSSDMA